MEIEFLTLSITETDISNGLGRWLPKDGPIKGIRAHIRPEGIEISGKLKGLLRVGIQLGVLAQAGSAVVRLERVKGFFGWGKGKVLGEIRKKLDGKPGFTLVDDAVVIDVDRAIGLSGVTARANLSALRLEPGRLVIKCALEQSSVPLTDRRSL